MWPFVTGLPSLGMFTRFVVRCISTSSQRLLLYGHVHLLLYIWVLLSLVASFCSLPIKFLLTYPSKPTYETTSPVPMVLCLSIITVLFTFYYNNPCVPPLPHALVNSGLLMHMERTLFIFGFVGPSRV